MIGAANTTYTIDLFATPTATPGQGQNILGTLNVTTNAGGMAPFLFSAPLPADRRAPFSRRRLPRPPATPPPFRHDHAGRNANTLYVGSVYARC